MHRRFVLINEYVDSQTFVRETEGMEMNLLYVLAVVLVILWLVGFLTATLGGLIHILLVLAIIAVLLRVIRGRKALGG